MQALVSLSSFLICLNKSVDSRLGMGYITERHKNYIAGSADGDSTFTFKNIDTNSIHNKDSFEKN